MIQGHKKPFDGFRLHDFSIEVYINFQVTEDAEIISSHTQPYGLNFRSVIIYSYSFHSKPLQD